MIRTKASLRRMGLKLDWALDIDAGYRGFQTPCISRLIDKTLIGEGDEIYDRSVPASGLLLRDRKKPIRKMYRCHGPEIYSVIWILRRT